jgi:hypothetical protein
MALAKRYVERSLAYSCLDSYRAGYCCDRFPENLVELGKAILGLAGAADHPCITWPGRHLVKQPGQEI